jgi:periplasmic protein TonB
MLHVEPVPLLLTLVDVSDRTAGPGELSAQLRVAAPPSPPATPPGPEPEIVEPAIQREPEPAPIPAARPKPVAKKAPAPSKPAPVVASAPSPTASGTGAAGSTGTDTRSSAPAWAPSARIRYEQLLFAWMDRHKQYPMLAQRRGLEGNGAIRVRIDRQGRVLERSVDQSTGETMLDQAALDMVRRANPFPAVPTEYEGDGFEFVAPIQYRLH